MEEHRHSQGFDPDSRQASGPVGRRGHGPDNVCFRQGRPRPEVCDRLDETAEGTRMGAEPAVRGGYRKDREVVSG